MIIRFLEALLVFRIFQLNQVYTQIQEADTTINPLQNFEFLIDGAWTADRTHQTFEWDVGEKSVVSKLYFTNNDTLKLVGEIT